MQLNKTTIKKIDINIQIERCYLLFHLQMKKKNSVQLRRISISSNVQNITSLPLNFIFSIT